MSRKAAQGRRLAVSENTDSRCWKLHLTTAEPMATSCGQHAQALQIACYSSKRVASVSGAAMAKFRKLCLFGLSALMLCLPVVRGDGPPSTGIKNLGMVAIKQRDGKHLQAHNTDGEMHASNSGRNEEETWFLFCVDEPKHIYALMNWRNGKFLRRTSDRDIVRADSTIIGLDTEWELISGKKYGVPNAVAFRSMLVLPREGRQERTLLAWNDHDTAGGGEVSSGSDVVPPTNNTTWFGWWVMYSVDQPSPGKDFWNTANKAVQGIANQIKPADVTALIAALGA